MREYDLLVGILACQLRLVSRGTLVHFAASLESRPGLSLLDYLVETRALTNADEAVLHRIVDSIVHAHHGDERAAFRAFGGDEAASEAFAGSIVRTDKGWGPSEDQTILSRELPHGLPAQIAPETIGRYTRGSEYARGGIGRILLVHDEQIGRDVILKELLPEQVANPTDTTLSRAPDPDSPKTPIRQSAAMLARFLQEARITGQLEHPSIVPVYELGIRKDGQLYYTMKLVRGETLSEIIKRCKTPEERLGLLRPFLDVCNAMAYAHTKGVIHRDLKPSNIMVGEFGECVVLDWGLAKMQKDRDAHREAMEKTISHFKLGEENVNGLQTRSKDVLGTPLYMSPEQARGEVDAVNVRSDVYSLGVILYEILSGELPHPWSNSLDTIRRVGTLAAPSIRKAAPHTPPELAAICDKALAFQAKDRYATAQDLAADIQSFLEGAVVGAYAYRFTDLLGRLYRRQRTVINLGLASAAALLAIGIYSYWQVYNANLKEREARNQAELNAESEKAARTEADNARRDAEAARTEAETRNSTAQLLLTQTYLDQQQIRLAGETLDEIPVAFRDWKWSLLKDATNVPALRVTTDDSAIYAAYHTPNGEGILTTRSRKAPAVWNINSGRLTREFKGDGATYSDIAFSRDGTLFAATGSGGVTDVWEVDSGDKIRRLLYQHDGLTVSFDEREYIWTGHNDGSFIKWNIATGDSEIVDTVSRSSASRISLAINSEVVLLLRDSSGEPDSGGSVIVALDKNTYQRLYSVPGDKFWVVEGRSEFIRLTHNSHGTSQTGSEIDTLTLHDLLTGELKRQYESKTEDIINISISSSGAQFVTSGMDGNIQVWLTDQSTPIRTIPNTEAMISAFLTPDLGHVIGCSASHKIIVWDIQTGLQILYFPGENPFLSSASYSPESRTLVTASAYHTFELFDIGDAIRNRVVPRHESTQGRSQIPSLTSFTVSRGGNVALENFSNGSIQLIELQSRRQLASFRYNDKNVPLPQISRDGSRVLFCPDKSSISVGHTLGGAVVAIESSSEPFNAIALAPSGIWAATSRVSTGIQIWHSDSTSERLNIVPQSPVRALAFNGNEKALVAGAEDGIIYQYDTTSGALLGEFSSNFGPIAAIAVSDDGNTIAVINENGTLSAWDAATAKLQMRLNIRTSNMANSIARYRTRFTLDARHLLIDDNHLFNTRVIDLQLRRELLRSRDGVFFEPDAGALELAEISYHGVLYLLPRSPVRPAQ